MFCVCPSVVKIIGKYASYVLNGEHWAGGGEFRTFYEDVEVVVDSSFIEAKWSLCVPLCRVICSTGTYCCRENESGT